MDGAINREWHRFGTDWCRSAWIWRVLVLWEKVKIESFCVERRGTGPFPELWASRADQLTIPKCTTLDGEVTAGCGSWCVGFWFGETDWKARSTLVRGGGRGVGGVGGTEGECGVFVGDCPGAMPQAITFGPLWDICESVRGVGSAVWWCGGIRFPFVTR